MLKRPLAVLGKRKVRPDLVEAALLEACAQPGPRQRFDHFGQMEGIAQKAEDLLQAKNLPERLRDGARVIYVHGTHRKTRTRGRHMQTLRIEIHRQKGTWLLMRITDVVIWEGQQPFFHMTIPLNATKYLISDALSGIWPDTSDPEQGGLPDYGGLLCKIAEVIPSKNASTHEKISAVQIVDDLLASGYVRNNRQTPSSI